MTSLQYDVTADDIVAFRIFCAERPEQRRRVLTRLMVLILVMPVAAFALAWVADGFRPMRIGYEAVAMAVLPSVPVLLVAVCLGRLQRGRIRADQRAREAGIMPGVRDGPTRLDASAEGLRVTAPLARSLYDWRAISGIEETPDHLFILMGPLLAVPVPKRGLDPAALDALRTTVARMLAARDATPRGPA